MWSAQPALPESLDSFLPGQRLRHLPRAPGCLTLRWSVPHVEVKLPHHCLGSMGLTSTPPFTREEAAQSIRSPGLRGKPSGPCSCKYQCDTGRTSLSAAPTDMHLHRGWTQGRDAGRAPPVYRGFSAVTLMSVWRSGCYCSHFCGQGYGDSERLSHLISQL